MLPLLRRVSWLVSSAGDDVRKRGQQTPAGRCGGHTSLGELCVGPQGSMGASLYLQSDS